MKVSRIAGLGGVVLLVLAWGCSTSRITHSWKAENLAARKFNKISVRPRRLSRFLFSDQ